MEIVLEHVHNIGVVSLCTSLLLISLPSQVLVFFANSIDNVQLWKDARIACNVKVSELNE